MFLAAQKLGRRQKIDRAGGEEERKRPKGLRASVSFTLLPLPLSEFYEINALKQAKYFI